MSNALKTALGVVGIVVATQAAAQVTLYSREDFRGESFTADREMLPDPDNYAKALRESFETLKAAATQPAAKPANENKPAPKPRDAAKPRTAAKSKPPAKPVARRTPRATGAK